MADTVSAATVLDFLLRGAGIPIDGVSADESSRQVRVDYAASATAAQRAQGQTLVSNFDWSVAALAADRTQMERGQAKAVWQSSDQKLVRAVVFYLLQQIKTAVPIYTVPSRAAVDQAIRSILDGGTVDS